MARVWLRAVSRVNQADETGTLKTYEPGDWFETSKQRAIELLETGQAEIPDEAKAQRALTQDLDDCGIYLREGSIRDARDALDGLKVDVIEYSGAIRVPFARTLIWHPRLPLQRKQIALGFARVEDTGTYASWEVAAMMRSNEMLASEIGDKADQRATLEVAGDLRLPVYETGAVWVRRTNSTEALVRAWNAALETTDCDEHAFLRALYTHRVLLCTLPPGWLGRWRR